MNLTEKELALINAIVKSEYAGDEITDPVWLPYPEDCGFDNAKTLSGVVSQLVQKGIVYVCGKGNDAQIQLTEKYAESLTIAE